MAMNRKFLFVFVLVILAGFCDAKRKSKNKKKASMSNILKQKETNAIDFVRLVAMRLIYGVATRVGLGEPISEALNGAFVPPGVDDYSDYGDFGLLDREDDYDYR